jgi:hypothetical protein
MFLTRPVAPCVAKVYIDVLVGDVDPIIDEDGQKHQTALTQVRFVFASALTINSSALHSLHCPVLHGLLALYCPSISALLSLYCPVLSALLSQYCTSLSVLSVRLDRDQSGLCS